MPSSVTADGSTKYVYQLRVNLHCPEYHYPCFQIKHYEVLVCASQLRWGLSSFESAGSLSQGTVILAQQNQQLAQSQQGSAAWNSQAGGFSPRGLSGGFTTQTGFSNVRSATNVRETRNTYNSHETSTFIGTTLSVNDIPRFIPNMSVVPPVDDRMKKLAYA